MAAGQRHHQWPAVPHGLRGRPGGPPAWTSPAISTARIEGLRTKFGEIGDTRLTVMAALTVADELAETGRAYQGAGSRNLRPCRMRAWRPPIATRPPRRRSRPRSLPPPSASRASPGSSIRPSAAASRWGNCLARMEFLPLPPSGDVASEAGEGRSGDTEFRHALPHPTPARGEKEEQAARGDLASEIETKWRRRMQRTTLGRRGCPVREESNPRGLTILKGAVPGRAPGFGHMAPTYLCRFPGSALPRPARLRTLRHGRACPGHPRQIGF